MIKKLDKGFLLKVIFAEDSKVEEIREKASKEVEKTRKEEK